MKLNSVASEIEKIEALDKVGDSLGGVVKKLIPAGPLKDTLSGTWLGHQLHPLLTDIPIGSFTSATLLDFFGGRRAQPAANFLTAVGLMATVPTAAAGLADWSDTYGAPRRVGVVHAAANAVGASFYAASVMARHRGNRFRAASLGLMGMGVMTLGGYLGGHLTLVRGVGVNRTMTEDPSSEWTTAIADDELSVGAPRVVDVDDVPTLLYRTDDRRYALSNRCTHAGGPLNEGEFDNAALAGPCVKCPWHQSVFSLDDGSVLHGPASVPEPTYDVRAVDGKVEVRRR